MIWKQDYTLPGAIAFLVIMRYLLCGTNRGISDFVRALRTLCWCQCSWNIVYHDRDHVSEAFARAI